MVRDVMTRSVVPALFTAIVTEGVVSISARVERRSTAEIVERTASMLLGVIPVQADVAWELGDSRAEPASVDPGFPFGPR